MSAEKQQDDEERYQRLLAQLKAVQVSIEVFLEYQNDQDTAAHMENEIWRLCEHLGWKVEVNR